MSEVLSLVDEGPSHVLGLEVGSSQVQPGVYFPRAGELSRRREREDEEEEEEEEEEEKRRGYEIREERLTDQDAQNAPKLFLPPGTSPNKTYLVVSLDIDAPYPSCTILGPILHWIQSGLTASTSGGELTGSAPIVANYIGPAPPPLSSPHRYIFVLYEEPAGFNAAERAPPNGQDFPTWQRVRFDMDKWAKEAGLGEPLSVNYFVSN